MKDTAEKAWKCDIEDKSGVRTMVVTAGQTGSWEITSKKGPSPWVTGINGCHSFSSEEAAKSVYDKICGNQKWKFR